MTSKLTREENVQAVFDLKAGYTLGIADVEILKRVARMALAAMDSEPVAYMVRRHDEHEGTGTLIHAEFLGRYRERGDFHYVPLYRHAQQPVVPDAIPVSRDIDAGYLSGWNACRSAILQPDSSPVIPDGSTAGMFNSARALLDALYEFGPDEIAISEHVTNLEDALRNAAAMLQAGSDVIGSWGNGKHPPSDKPAPIDHGYRPDCECSGCKAMGRICAELAGWIPVSERMPERKYVLAADFSGKHYSPCQPNTQVGIYADWFDDGNSTWDVGDGNDLHLKQVTHWMPLPAAPQEVSHG